jgi:predicted restriction endonuclease
MAREGDFPSQVKIEAYHRQGGVCAMCGVPLFPPRSTMPSPRGAYSGEAHHLRPLHHGGKPTLDNCVYLCYGDHKLVGHGMAPFGIDKQGGSSQTWVKLSKGDFLYWVKGKR